MSSQQNVYRRILSIEPQNVMNDGRKCVDFVLVHDVYEHLGDERIKCFEKSLRRQGLQLETHQETNLVFTKIHAHASALKRNCEIMKLRVPVKTNITKQVAAQESDRADHKLLFVLGYVLHIFCIKTRLLPKLPYKMTEEYSRNKSFLFADNTEELFSLSDRCMIVNFILERARFSDDVSDVGISKLLEEGVYIAAYPPHDGQLEDEGSARGRLVRRWASWSCLFKFQPLDDIKDYFGMKCALYFAWIGFYTDKLVTAALLSALFLLYGVCTWPSDHLSAEVCSAAGELLMCPQCDQNCDYWSIQNACWYYRLRHLIDNDGTPFYVFVMSVWSALYLKQWQRYSAEIRHRWGLSQSTLYPETIRKQKSACCASCGGSDHHQRVLRRMKWPCILLSYSIVLFLVSLPVLCVILTILYTMVVITTQFIHGELWAKYHQSLWVPITSALLYYVAITLLNLVYNRISEMLTKLEYHRTQTDFDNSLYLKLYIFQFVNYYFLFFYLAFIKGKLIGHPAEYVRVFGYRQEECEPGGCLMEICIQIMVFMVAEQLRDNIAEYVWPLATKWWQARTHEEQLEQPRPWLQDFKLNIWGNNTLFDEYLEMVIQFGYIALFVAACPLAAVLALFNNCLIEIRLDAKKFVKFFRRPIAQRVPDIGIWSFILNVVSKLSIFTNAWLIASSTNLIPKWVYKMTASDDYTSVGFLNYSLSQFSVHDFDNMSTPARSAYNVSSCWYFDHRHPFESENKYEKTLAYWHILVAKLVFIIAYNALVSSVVTVIDWWAPSMPPALRHQIEKEENYILDLIMKHFESDGSDFRDEIRRSGLRQDTEQQ